MSQTTTTTTLLLLSTLLIAAIVVNGQGAKAPPPNAGMVCDANLGLCAAALKVGAKSSEECCTSLEKAVKTQLKCLCAILTNPQVLAGFNLTVENALLIPKSCGIDAGPSMCSAAKAPLPHGVPPVPGPPKGEKDAASNLAGTGLKLFGSTMKLLLDAPSGSEDHAPLYSAISFLGFFPPPDWTRTTATGMHLPDQGNFRRGEGGGGSSGHERNEHMVFPKPETIDFDLPCDTSYPQQFGDNAASSSGSNVKSLLIEMGFCPTLVQKAIDENGEDDLELLLEILTKSSVTEHPEPSFHGLMEPKPEPDTEYEVDGKRMALLGMKFPENLVDFALDRLGKDAQIDVMVDFIVAAQLAEKFAEESDESLDDTEINEEDEDVIPVAARGPEVPNEVLFETMDKTLHLLEMGFSNHEISIAIEKIGTEGQISDLAETIVTGEAPRLIPNDLEEIEKKVSAAPAATCLSKSWRFLGVGAEKVDSGRGSSSGAADIKPDTSTDPLPFSTTANVGETSRGKRLKDEDDNAFLDEFSDFDDRGKRPRPEYMETPWMQDDKDNTYGFSSAMQPRLSQTLSPDVATRPYFFYGNLSEISPRWCSKISGYLFGIHPEHVDTRLCSALRRTEGYVHNLPVENRFNILPKPLLTIQDAMPHMKSWWPQWDVRKHLSSVACSDIDYATTLCERLGRRLAECKGKPSQQDQTIILRHCHTSNLIWIAPNILSPVEPEHLECIMGYPTNHTKIGGARYAERLKLFEFCFQTDTLGYHLSVLKSLFPEGLTVLSLFSGIGGAEITLNRLGIHLKNVVSVEHCGLSRNILKRWWQSSGQTGELVQIEAIRSLSTNKLEALVERFGGFDFVICQNPPIPPDLSKETGSNEARDFDYSLFNEFVRVTKRVIHVMASS
uniref:SAM-dependent MTase DRM-type domain-containing protein n=1 Tax=Brassica campestris TaxID=3711 RepID=A0A3P5YX62_BRACM|nr:unnamed protein product [Brassica rapa]